jgi:AraC-like DNA-binding protein
MSLHLIRRDHGAALANSIARILVTSPHRDGGQQQYIAAPLAAADGDRLAGVIAWAWVNLDRQLSLDELAARALMSRRTFVRHFKAATGATPRNWLVSQRLGRAEELLETTRHAHRADRRTNRQPQRRRIPRAVHRTARRRAARVRAHLEPDGMSIPLSRLARQPAIR